jgi:hypothetical protein
MTTLTQKRIELYSLKIKDSALEEAYNELRYKEINKMSHYIVIAKFVYSSFIVVQIITEGISIVRPAMYIFTSLIHYNWISLVKVLPNLQKYHACISNITYVSFTLNDPSLYKSPSDHVALLIGFIANSYLSGTFLSCNWVYTTISQLFSTILVLYFFGKQNQIVYYDMIKIFPAFILVVISVALNSYYVEL